MTKLYTTWERAHGTSALSFFFFSLPLLFQVPFLLSVIPGPALWFSLGFWFCLVTYMMAFRTAGKHRRASKAKEGGTEGFIYLARKVFFFSTGNE